GARAALRRGDPGRRRAGRRPRRERESPQRMDRSAPRADARLRRADAGRARAPRGVALLERAAAEGQDRRFLRRLAQRADHAPRAARYERRRVRARDRTGGAPGEDARRRGRAAPQVLVPWVEEGAEETAEEGAREARGALQTLRRGERGVPA